MKDSAAKGRKVVYKTETLALPGSWALLHSRTAGKVGTPSAEAAWMGPGRAEALSRRGPRAPRAADGLEEPGLQVQEPRRWPRGRPQVLVGTHCFSCLQWPYWALFVEIPSLFVCLFVLLTRFGLLKRV